MTPNEKLQKQGPYLIGRVWLGERFHGLALHSCPQQLGLWVGGGSWAWWLRDGCSWFADDSFGCAVRFSHWNGVYIKGVLVSQSVSQSFYLTFVLVHWISNPCVDLSHSRANTYTWLNSMSKLGDCSSGGRYIFFATRRAPWMYLQYKKKASET